MKLAAVFFCYRDLSNTDLMAFNYSIKNLKRDFDVFCITTTKQQSYVENILGIDIHKTIVRDSELASINKYTRFLKNIAFYDLFKEYEYLLVWQEDAVILRELKEFKQLRDASFIGAPISKSSNDYVIEYVGNGGLSFRNVEDHRSILESKINLKNPTWFTNLSVRNRLTYYVEKISSFSGISLINYNEDFFWCCLVDDATYRVPSIDLARHFFWETDLHILNLQSCELPFGCHAWEKYANPENKRLILDLIT